MSGGWILRGFQATILYNQLLQLKEQLTRGNSQIFYSQIMTKITYCLIKNKKNQKPKIQKK